MKIIQKYIKDHINGGQELAWFTRDTSTRGDGENDSIRDGAFSYTTDTYMGLVREYPTEEALFKGLDNDAMRTKILIEAQDKDIAVKIISEMKLDDIFTYQFNNFGVIKPKGLLSKKEMRGYYKEDSVLENELYKKVYVPAMEYTNKIMEKLSL